MKKNDLNDMRKKNIKDLKKTLEDKREELAKVRLDMSLGQESNFKKAKAIKTTVAQIMTLIKEKEIIEARGSEPKQDNKKGTKK